MPDHVVDAAKLHAINRYGPFYRYLQAHRLRHIGKFSCAISRVFITDRPHPDVEIRVGMNSLVATV